MKKLPNIWGAGALFAFSGLEGQTSYAHPMTGRLLGDDAGVRFETRHPFDLLFDCTGLSDLSWELVTSDILAGTMTEAGYALPATLLFVRADTVAGRCPRGRLRLRFASGSSYTADAEIDFADERYRLRIVPDGDTDVFSLSMDPAFICTPDEVREYERQHRSFFDALPPVAIREESIERTFYKAVSIMKSQVCSPEGQFRHRWTTPNRFPHRALWLWDSVFHSFGNAYIDPSLAEDSLLSVLDTQREDGFIPHMSTPERSSRVTQPPVLAWGAWKLWEKTHSTDFLRACYPRLERYLLWNQKNRTLPDGLYFWHVARDSVHCRCDESGMDNSPRFDGVAEMDCIDFSCYMLHEAEMMERIAAETGCGAPSFWSEFRASLAEKIAALLWDEADGMFYDRVPETGELHRVRSAASFLPLFAGACTPEQARRLAERLRDHTTFATPFGVPSIAASDALYGTDMWRGPVWINLNYMIAEGLRRYGFAQEADSLIRTTVCEIARWYAADGVLYEFYDDTMRLPPRALFRKGAPIVPYAPAIRYQSIRDYGWTATLCAAMILENPSFF